MITGKAIDKLVEESKKDSSIDVSQGTSVIFEDIAIEVATQQKDVSKTSTIADALKGQIIQDLGKADIVLDTEELKALDDLQTKAQDLAEKAKSGFPACNDLFPGTLKPEELIEKVIQESRSGPVICSADAATKSCPEPVKGEKSEVLFFFNEADNTCEAELLIVTNTVPTDIKMSNSSVLESSPVGALVGFFETVDQDINDFHKYHILAQKPKTENPVFTISGRSLVLSQKLDFELQSKYVLLIESNDGNAGIFSKEIEITVNDVVETVMIAIPDASMKEDSQLRIRLYALDGDQDPYSGSSSEFLVQDSGSDSQISLTADLQKSSGSYSSSSGSHGSSSSDSQHSGSSYGSSSSDSQYSGSSNISGSSDSQYTGSSNISGSSNDDGNTASDSQSNGYDSESGSFSGSDGIKYLARSEDLKVTLIVEGSMLTIRPDANHHGETKIFVSAEGPAGEKYGEVSFKLTITPVNDPPTMTKSKEQILEELDYGDGKLEKGAELKLPIFALRQYLKDVDCDLPTPKEHCDGKWSIKTTDQRLSVSIEENPDLPEEESPYFYINRELFSLNDKLHCDLPGWRWEPPCLRPLS